MKTKTLVLIATLFVGLTAAGCNKQSFDVLANDKTRPKKTMRPFKSEQDLRNYLKKLAKRPNIGGGGAGGGGNEIQTPSEVSADHFTLTDNFAQITNLQHAGVDEGGIVKLRGNHLVVLRRGRLFTIEVGDQTLRPVSAVDAYGPDLDPSDGWYDELLIAGDTVIVIGYSYDRGGTEIGLFHLDDKGNLTYRSTYHLRSNDYYSDRNYASRIVNGRLIFYSPLYLSPDPEDSFESFPALRKWKKDATDNDFHRIISPERIYRPDYNFKAGSQMALHTVTVCDPTGGELNCEATSVVGPEGRSFYVSPQSVYVWATDIGSEDKEREVQSFVYRMPLDGSAPSALKTSGAPVDQFSFLESVDNYLNVLVREKAKGDGMWLSARATGDAWLLRIPLASFSDGGEAVFEGQYQRLPTPKGYFFRNRFVGDYLLYGVGVGFEGPEQPTEFAVYAVRWSGGDSIKLPLKHYVDRIEVMGKAAVIVGTAGNELHFSALSLGNLPKVEFDYVRPQSSQGEDRSHGFFYKPDGENSGVLGLPVRSPGSSRYESLFNYSASIVYLRNDSFRLSEIGNLAANFKNAIDDRCRASCVDWYGNSRPIFFQNRIFALLGYELVEGAYKEGRIEELRRLNYAPTKKDNAGD